jgi:DNA-binding winged helix-turn-helix (wHTH) protein/tetratricopeptide (TPR) repeat protein
MEAASASHSHVVCFRFGPFEARLNDEVLLRHGEPVPIQRLPFQMLLLLLERAGELVTKEELRDRLWTETTNVEFTNGLQVAAAKLREALGESAASPIYFKTVSRRGYQFIAQATPVLGAPLERTAASPADETFRRVVRPRWVSLRPVYGCILLAAVAAGVWTVYRQRHSPKVNSGDTVLLGNFANATGIPELDGVFTSAFHRAMLESPYLRFLRAGNTEFAAAAHPDTLQQELGICRQQQADVLLTAELSRQGQTFRVKVSEWKCSNGRLLTEKLATATAEKDILSAIDTATTSLRRAMGEHEETLKRFSVPMQQATTSSIAALRAFTLGDLKRSEGETDEAFQDYKLATDLDPEFALAYARLGALATSNEDFSRADQYISAAFKLRNRTTDSERLYLAAQYYTSVTGDIDQAVEAYQVWRGLYPYDAIPDNNLAYLYMKLGDPVKAVDLARQAVQLQPGSKPAYATLAQAYQRTGDTNDLNPICRSTMREQNDIPAFHMACFFSAFEQADQAGMQFELHTPHGSLADIAMLETEAALNVYYGHAQKASALFTESKNAARKAGNAGFFAALLNDIALEEAEVGLSQQAKQDAEDAILEDPGNALVRAYSALALARIGDIQRAETLAHEAAAQSPANTIIVHSILPCVQSSIRLSRNDPAGAVLTLEPTRRLDFSFFLALAPAYYRGLAYERNHQLKEAAAEFQRVIDHRVIYPTSPYVLLSRLELGRTLLMMGSRDLAERQLSDLHTVWATADSTFPPLRLLETSSSLPIKPNR